MSTEYDYYNDGETDRGPSELNEINYNCTECPSPIEIISINKNEIEFKCINTNNIKKMKINEYLESMKKIDNNEINNDKCVNHNNSIYICYCFDCKKHLCKECLKSREHISHLKNYIIEILPNKNELNQFKKIINYYEDKIYQLEVKKMNKKREITNKFNEYKVKLKEKYEKNKQENDDNKMKDLKLNNDKYFLDIKDIHKKYINEIITRKKDYEKENKKINTKYKLRYQINNIKYQNKLEEIDKKYINIVRKFNIDKKIEDIKNIKRLNEIIYNTYHLYKNNYYNLINFNNMLIQNKNNNLIKDDKLKKLNFENKNKIINDLENEIKNLKEKLFILKSNEANNFPKDINEDINQIFNSNNNLNNINKEPVDISNIIVNLEPKQIKLKIENAGSITFYYSYTQNTTLSDLLEYVAYSFPKKKICPCFKFRGRFKKKELMELDNLWSFKNCIATISDFELYNPNKECKCGNIMKNNFTKSKIEIIENMDRISQINDKKNGLKNNGNTKSKSENNQKIILNKDIVFNYFYDIIINIKSICNITKGWKIKMSERIRKYYDKMINDKVIKIGVIGNVNVGKTFILSQISRVDLPNGPHIRTQGISIKFPELEKYNGRRIVLLDSPGMETPFLDENNQKENEDKKDLFKEKSGEKLITELFLQNYIINESDILIIVVGILTYSEQKLLNKIKIILKDLKINKKIFVIHNLMFFTNINQVKEYIDNVLLKSATFNLEPGHKISVFSEKENNNGIYFIEKNEDKYNYHYIMANEGSEAGNYCNEFVKNQLSKFFITAKDEPFDPIKSLKERFINFSKYIFENIDDPINIHNFENNNNESIKLLTPNNLVLKKNI